jgi:ActR/RegA family two-component response regulator
MSKEILVVDDDETFAKNLALYLENKAFLSAGYATTKDGTLDTVRTMSIKVAVLDQRMKAELGLNGTELAREIHRIDSRVRCIIFSARSEVPDYAESSKLRLLHLRKDEDELLVREIHSARMEYLAEAASQRAQNAELIGQYRARVFSGDRSVTFHLLDVETVSATPEIRPADYETVVQVDRGELTRQKVAISFTQFVLVEAESAQVLSAQSVLKLPAFTQLTGKLQSSLQAKYQNTYQYQIQQANEIERALTKEDLREGIVGYVIQRAPYYLRNRAVVRVTCQCCGLTDIVMLPFRWWDGRFHRRRIEYLRDNTNRAIDLGDIGKSTS